MNVFITDSLKTQSKIVNVLILFFSKLYWTDGNTINMANMDGSNSKILFQNQKDPVGKYSFFLFLFLTDSELLWVLS